MELTPAKFLSLFLVLSAAGWLLFTFTARLLAWVLSNLIGAVVRFRIGGLTCLKDVSLKFHKGSVESVSIGELKICFRRPFTGSNSGLTSRVPRLQVLICDSEVVIRSNTKQASHKVSQHQKNRSGRGKWVILVNIAKYLTITVMELVVQIPKWTMEVKELDLSMHSEEASLSLLGVRLMLVACTIIEREKQGSTDNSSGLSFRERLLSVGGLASRADRNPAPFSVEQVLLSSRVGHEREKGVTIRQVDVTCGEVSLDLSEEFFEVKKISPETTLAADDLETRHDRPLRSVEVGHSFKTDEMKSGDFVLANIPERASFSLPRLLMKFSHHGKGVFLENEVTGIQLRTAKLQTSEETGDGISRLDIHMDCGELKLLRESDKSFMEIMRVAVAASLEIPKQPGNLLQVEVDLKLGGAQCNLLINRFEHLVYLLNSMKGKDKDTRHVSEGKHPAIEEKLLLKQRKMICWTFTLSAPEMAISAYSLDGVVLYNAFSQTSHLFMNSISKQGIGIHAELGEFCIYMADEEHECFKESLFGVDTNPGCLLQISRVTVDWGVNDSEITEDLIDQKRVALVVEVNGSTLFLTLQHLQYILSSSMAFAAHFKSLSNTRFNQSSKKGSISKGKQRKKGTRVLKLCLEGFSVHFCDQLHVSEMDVPDPKKVNFGNQQGEVVIMKNNDGKPRVASIKVAVFKGVRGSSLKCKTIIDLAHLQLCIDKDKGDSEVELQRIKAVYQELGAQDRILTEVILLGLQTGKVVHRFIALGNGTVGRSLISATNLTGRWEPDVHLFFYDFALRMQSLFQKHKEKASRSEITGSNLTHGKPEDVTHQSQKSNNLPGKVKGHSPAVAVDIEHVEFSAALADGVEGSLLIQSVFSEDVRIGILLEELKSSLNGATVCKSARLQVARLPFLIQDSKGLTAETDPLKAKTSTIHCWDYLIQGSGIYIIMPYRLQCRAIDDAIEDMWRGLKLSMAAQKSTASCMRKKVTNTNLEKKSSSSVGSVKFILEDISAEVEEEPLQGWLDEHQQLLKKQVCELSVRERLLEEVLLEGCSICPSQGASPDLRDGQLGGILEGKDVDLSDPLVQKKLREKLKQQAFQTYEKECHKLEAYEGSGSCRNALQAGFKPSENRRHLFSIQASDLQVTLMDVPGGRQGMIEVIRKLDSVKPELEIPFSRILGKHASIRVSTLVVRIRDYTFPMFSATGGKCDGDIIFARQATCFPKQFIQEVYIGRWRKLSMLRSQSGTTPPFKMYSELPIEFEKAEVAYGVGFEPAFADVSYSFTVALRKADLSVHDSKNDSQSSAPQSSKVPLHTGTGALSMEGQPLKKERSLPWWDDMRYYVHGRNKITATNFKWVFLATTNPYEKRDMMKIVAGLMEIHQWEGRLSFIARDFNLLITSLEYLKINQDFKQVQTELGQRFIRSPYFQLDVSMDWECESGNPLFHYLHALPSELVTREIVYSPFRSTSLALGFNFRLRASSETEDGTGPLGDMEKALHKSKLQNGLPLRKATHKATKDALSLSPPTTSDGFCSDDVPQMNLGAHDLIWIFKWWNIYYSPPHRLRTFSKWPRFGVPRMPRSGNLALDKVLTEFMLRVDATPACIKHMPLVRDDPAEGLTFNMKKLKYELCYSRGRQRYTFDSKRDILELVYQGLDLHVLKAELKRELSSQKVCGVAQTSENVKQLLGLPDVALDEPSQDMRLLTKSSEHGFLLSTDYFSMRKQAPKADSLRLSSWQEGRKFASIDSSYGETEFTHGSGSDPTRSDPSDDDGFNIVLPDNCLRVSLYGLKLLWTIENRNAVWAWVEDISRAFEPPKPSPSRQYAQRKMIEEKNKLAVVDARQDEAAKSISSIKHIKGSSVPPSPAHQEEVFFSPCFSGKPNSLPCVPSGPVKEGYSDDTEEEGTLHFMVNVIQPQFNLHAEEARGRFLLAAASGKVIARSFHSIVHLWPVIIEQAVRADGDHLHGTMPEMTWKRRELSVLLEQVQAHVAPTDVDPGAGLQWLPKIPKGAPKVKRTGALLERVFMPCTMYFQYTRNKSGTADLKVKPLKELYFNSPNITATMTSPQFQIMVDIISNLLLARLPKPRKNSLQQFGDEDEGADEEADEVVPDGVVEVELARIKLEESERELKLLSDDLQIVSHENSPLRSTEADVNAGRQEGKLWMLTSGKSALACRLEDELGKKWKARKLAANFLRNALQGAAQQRLTEKEKNKSPSFAMRISWAIDKVVWSMISDGETFAEAEISNMTLNVDRDYHDVGVAQFTTKHFVVKNCMRNAKSNTLLSAWNPPVEWGRNVMLRVDAKQGAPHDGRSSLELFQVEIFPLKIHLTEIMYRMMWQYLFPEEDQDSQRRQVWKASTTAVVKRGKKSSASNERFTSNSAKREVLVKPSGSVPLGAHPQFLNREWQCVDFRMTAQALEKHVKTTTTRSALSTEHRRTSSFDKTWEENLPESVAWEVVPRVNIQASSSSSRNTCHTHAGELDSGFQNSNTASTSNAENGSIKSREGSRSNKLNKTSSQEDKKVGRTTSQEEKRESRLRPSNLEFQNIKISQVELLVTYEGSRLSINDLRLLMDTFTRVEFTGTWRRLFSRVKKHIIWSVLKSVTGMQGKKFKDKLQAQGQTEAGGYPGSDSNSSDSDESNAGTYEQFSIPQFKRHKDRAGDGFVSSIRGLFNLQRKKAKALVLRTMRVDGEADIQGDWSESEVDSAPFTRQLSISKAKRLLRRHTKKFLSAKYRGGILFKDLSLPSPKTSPFQSEASSDASSRYEDFND